MVYFFLTCTAQMKLEENKMKKLSFFSETLKNRCSKVKKY